MSGAAPGAIQVDSATLQQAALHWLELVVPVVGRPPEMAFSVHHPVDPATQNLGQGIGTWATMQVRQHNSVILGAEALVSWIFRTTRVLDASDQTNAGLISGSIDPTPL